MLFTKNTLLENALKWRDMFPKHTQAETVRHMHIFMHTIYMQIR